MLTTFGTTDQATENPYRSAATITNALRGCGPISLLFIFATSDYKTTFADGN